MRVRGVDGEVCRINPVLLLDALGHGEAEISRPADQIHRDEYKPRSGPIREHQCLREKVQFHAFRRLRPARIARHSHGFLWRDLR